jgi:hypothetical protein
MLKGLSLLAASQVKGVVSRNLRALPYFVLALLIFIFGFSFLLDFLKSWLSLRMSTMAASGVMAAVLLTLAGAAMVIGHAIKHKKPKDINVMAASAMMAAPFASRLMGKKLTLQTIGVVGVLFASVLLGRFLKRS